MKQVNPQKLGKCLVYTSAIIAIIAVFFMFLRGIKWNAGTSSSGGYNPTLFDGAFGLNGVYRKGWFTAMFVFECIIIVTLGYVLVSGLLNKNIEILDNILIIVSCIISIILIIIVFNSRNIFGYVLSRPKSDNSLGVGAILFGIAHCLSLVLNICGLGLMYFVKLK